MRAALLLLALLASASGFGVGPTTDDSTVERESRATPIGLCAALNLFLGGLLCASRLVQWYVFGKLRVAEWQRLWDRLLNYSMGQLVILGAVVEPDVGELLQHAGLPQYLAGFEREALEPSQLSALLRLQGKEALDAVLKEAGVDSMGHRIKLANLLA